MDLMEALVRVGMFFPPFLFALCFHEFAHGYVAKLKGDNTADMMGRLTMNPLPHIDWVGTVGFPVMAILFPGLPIFGWAKPVPVNPRNLKDQKNDMFWVALAGPMSNILLFLLGLVGFGLMIHVFHVAPQGPLMQMTVTFLYINMLLAFFNLLPLHPLDGGKIMARFLPYQWNRWLEDNQMQLNLVLLGLILLGGFRYLAAPFFMLVQLSMQFIISLGGA